jgi:uncharacterized membrane protein
MKDTSYIVQAGMLAAIYAGATLVCNLVLPTLSWGPVQIRLSEAICVVALIYPSAKLGLPLGCAIANLINIVIAGTGILGLLDVVFGSTATLLGAILCWKLRKKPKLAIFMFVITNSLIVPAYLPILCQWTGFYTIPFTNISLDGYWIWMYLFGVASIFISESLTLYVLGLPVYKALKKAKSV